MYATHHHPVSFNKVLEIDGSCEFDVHGHLGIIPGEQHQQQHWIVLIDLDLTQELFRCNHNTGFIYHYPLHNYHTQSLLAAK